MTNVATWVENKHASLPQYSLFIAGLKVCTISQRKSLRDMLDYWTYEETYGAAETMIAFDAEGAKTEAVITLKLKFRQMFEALEMLQ